jgi:hypothetical protein
MKRENLDLYKLKSVLSGQFAGLYNFLGFGFWFTYQLVGKFTVQNTKLPQYNN